MIAANEDAGGFDATYNAVAVAGGARDVGGSVVHVPCRRVGDDFGELGDEAALSPSKTALGGKGGVDGGGGAMVVGVVGDAGDISIGV